MFGMTVRDIILMTVEEALHIYKNGEHDIRRQEMEEAIDQAIENLETRTNE